ncbi:MAG: hypothetical protein GVY36_10605 [Verrucomicrobia bacterium]|jgi:hypothetical protein|nr:hypothetical protein [Verrucomicrobiota bacterium]
MDDRNKDDIEKVAKLFIGMGAARGQANGMAAQLLKRAEQIAQERDISKVAALESLLKQVIEARRGA